MDAVKLGAFLKKLRKEKGLTQEQLAEQFCVTNRTVSRWETGVNLPDIDILIDLSEFYEIDIRELLNGERKALNMPMGETEVLLKVSEYSTMKEKQLIGKVYAVVIAGMVAIGFLFYTTLMFFDDVISSGMVLLTLIIMLLLYSITMQAFREGRSAGGYLVTLMSGILSVILSNSFILCLFFGTGSFHNYGLLGAYYIVGIAIVTFLVIGVATRSLIKRQNKNEAE